MSQGSPSGEDVSSQADSLSVVGAGVTAVGSVCTGPREQFGPRQGCGVGAGRGADAYPPGKACVFGWAFGDSRKR